MTNILGFKNDHWMVEVIASKTVVEYLDDSKGGMVLKKTMVLQR